jgi:phenylacetic acid degradation operon negative regulatory protein
MLQFQRHMKQERNAPLSARSVVASTLLGLDPPVLPAQVLVRSGELFGIAEGTTRVALSRMVAAGELVADGDGRYRLAGQLLDRHHRQRLSRRSVAGQRPWQGTWWVAIVTSQGPRPAAERVELRERMAAARYGELREGVWARPANLADIRLTGDELTWATAEFDDGPAVARRLWDLDGWAARAHELVEEMDHWSPALAAHDLEALPDTFVLSAAVLRHLQADPLLPAELLPAGWPGVALRARYDAFDAAFVEVWRDWHRAFVSR